MVANDSLFWSDALGAWTVGDDLADTIPDHYLFRPDDRFSKLFWKIAADMAQLNDYCVLCLSATKKKLNGLRKELQDMVPGEAIMVVEDGPMSGDHTGEMIMVMSDQVPIWENTYHFLSRASCLILLSAFTEKSLKSVCLELAPEEAQPRRSAGESKIDMYVRFLQEICNLDFDEPQGMKAIRERCRQVRNSFAHGDWDRLQGQTEDIHLRNAFAATADLFRRIEESAWRSPWRLEGTNRAD